MAGSSKRVASKVATKRWRAEALKLRAEGWTLTQLAAKFGKSVSTVHEGLARELAAIPAEGVKALRQVHGAQLDAIVRGNIAKARKGEANAGFVIIAAIGAKAKLFGLYAVEKVDVTAALTLSFDAHQQLIDRLDKLASAADAAKAAASEEAETEPEPTPE